MAFSTLTNAKTIIGLGPNRSILGTIIRPDPVLLERKGGCNGDETFDSLLPGAGEPVHLDFEHQRDLMFNWQLDDEEPLPRGNDIAGAESADSIHASKRKKASRNEIKENGELRKIKNEENGMRKGRHLKKKSRI